MAGRNGRQSGNEGTVIDATFSAALEALANPVRMRIILMLREREQCVCHLTEKLGLSQGTVSYHMGLLKQAGLVADRRDDSDARWVYYRIDPDGATALQFSLAAVLDTTRTDQSPADCCDNTNECGPQNGGT